MSMILFETLEKAYWDHIETYGRNAPFEYNQVKYSRYAQPIKSNSGKSNVGWYVMYQDEQGNAITNHAALAQNRRNDPNRHWGAERD